MRGSALCPRSRSGSQRARNPWRARRMRRRSGRHRTRRAVPDSIRTTMPGRGVGPGLRNQPGRTQRAVRVSCRVAGSRTQRANRSVGHPPSSHRRGGRSGGHRPDRGRSGPESVSHGSPTCFARSPASKSSTTGRRGSLTSVYTRGSQRTGTLILLDGVPLNDPGGEVNLANLGQRRHRPHRGCAGAGERRIRRGSRRRCNPVVHPPGRPGEHGAEGRPLLRARQPGNRRLAGRPQRRLGLSPGLLAPRRAVSHHGRIAERRLSQHRRQRQRRAAHRRSYPTARRLSRGGFRGRGARPSRPTASSIRTPGRPIATPACRCAWTTPAAATSCNSFPSATIGCATCTPTRLWKVRTQLAALVRDVAEPAAANLPGPPARPQSTAGRDSSGDAPGDIGCHALSRGSRT